MQSSVGFAFASALVFATACDAESPGGQARSTGSGGNGGGASGAAGAHAGAAGAGGLAVAGRAGAGAGTLGGSSGDGGLGGSAGTSGAAGGQAGSVGGGGVATTPDGPAGHALNGQTGALNVDYANYLSKHDIIYQAPNTNPLYGLTLGNGRVGAMVWSENGLTLQVSGVDTSQQTAFSGGLVNLQTSPPIDDGATSFQQRLSLHDGVLTTTYGAGRVVSVFGSPGSEVVGIHVEDERDAVSSVSLELRLWDLSALVNHGGVPNLETWKTVSVYADTSGAALSRGQTDSDGFGYTLAASVEGANYTAETAGAGAVRLRIEPARSYTIWLACSSRLNAPNRDSVAEAKRALVAARAGDYEATLTSYKNFWHDFWSRSFVEYEGRSGEADYLENFYYLATYLIASGGYGNYPFHFINGVYRATADNTKWSSAYWYWNQRNVYNSFLASNHAELIGTFNRMYSRNFDALKSETMRRYSIDGIWVPETMGWDGDPSGTTGSDYTRSIYSTGVEAAENMYLQYKYTDDTAYLTETAYPFMREVAKFYTAMLTRNGAGKYGMELSHAHETYWNVRNAITDLAAVRSLFPHAIEVSAALNLDAPLRARWQDVLDNLVPYSTTGTEYLPHEPPIAQTRNNENVACELIWPYGVTGMSAGDHELAVNTWRRRPFPYGNVWANDAAQAARLGLGDEAFGGMKTMLERYQSYPNGFTNNTNGVFEYVGMHLVAMNESLLQSYDDTIRVFPALPVDENFVARFTLLAKGGFLVSAERETGETKYVGVRSLHGNLASVVHPWPGEVARVRRMSDGAVVATDSDGKLDFSTSRGEQYVIERTAKTLDSFVYSYIPGADHGGVRRLRGTPCSLGL